MRRNSIPRPLPPVTTKKGQNKKVSKLLKPPHPVVRKLRWLWFTFLESKFYIKVKKYGPKAIWTIIRNCGISAIGSGMFLALLNLFGIITLTWLNYLECFALYFIVEELKHYHLITINLKNKRYKQ